MGSSDSKLINLNECVKTVYNEYKKSININNLNKECKSCKHKCKDTDNNCKENCEKYYCNDSINDIDKIIEIINKIHNKENILFFDIKNIGEIIKNNFTSEDKKIIKEQYTKQLNCKNEKKSCTINKKLLLHVILYNILKKNITNQLKEKISQCDKTIGEPLESETLDIEAKPIDIEAKPIDVSN
jgi:hypothetical protein